MSHRSLLLRCGIAAPLLAFACTAAALTVFPGFNHARQYLSELGGPHAHFPAIFNAGVFLAGLMAALAGGGFGLTVFGLTGSRFAGLLIAAVFALSGYGLVAAALYPWPDHRHHAINLALGIQLAPLLLLWGLRPRRDLVPLKIFLAVAVAAMAVLTVLTKHLLVPGLVNDANVGWWEKAYAVILVGWVGVAAALLDRRLNRELDAQKSV